MSLYGITRKIIEDPKIKDAVKCIETGFRKVILNGIFGGGKSAVLSSVLDKLKRPALIITSSHEKAEKICAEIKLFLQDKGPYPDKESVHLFRAPDIIPYEKVSPSREVVGERLNVLGLLAQDKPSIIVAPIKSAIYKTIPKGIFKGAYIVINTGNNKTKREELIRDLVNLGYKRVEMVGERGEFSVRGGIVDIFPSNMEYPLRIEYVGDEIESIRGFDVFSQRSKENLDQAKILPSKEIVISKEARKKITSMSVKTEDMERIIEGEYFDGIEYFAPLLYEEERSIFNYLSKECLVVIDEGIEIKMAAEHLLDEAEDIKKSEEATEEEKVALPEAAYLTFDEMLSILEQKQVIEASNIEYLEKKKEEEEKLIPFDIEPSKNYVGRAKSLADDCLEKSKAGWQTYILSRQAMRTQEILGDNGVEAEYLTEIGETATQNIATLPFELQSGFVVPDLKIQVLTDIDIFGENAVSGKFKAPEKIGVSEEISIDLSLGDFVVHSNHGIGIYRGLEKLKMEGVLQEYLLIEYAEGDKLYVPLHQMGQIQKYSSSGDYSPKINRLGGALWKKTKDRVKKSIEDMTNELLELYAVRSKIKGHAFPQDNIWQKELEGSFPYEETDDQKKAIAEVKADMGSKKPMERLICGDVGFGKTEVALRAAFKAAASGKQVAMLVPTTVLAQQHYSNFLDRFKSFPIKVEMLSRFKSAKEQELIIKEVEKGLVDVVIGTHRLLQKDVKFKDLGLLIIDEEQRFGVKHKEKLKKLKKNLDVLTLTATPIPRTLYLSLSGARDVSMIATPPVDRSPIRTYILEWNDAVIKEAVLRELDRNGQVYFVHNSVEGIGKVAEKIKRLVPDAKVTVGHGQMAEGKLERVMSEFMTKKYDVLVCTTIIESGIDIPNVNTIIINNAEKFGLADLYQLRGRVGRSAAKAYAYLFYEKKNLSAGSSLERLEAIKEFTSLGSGYKLALRDLEIRGAGNLLGKEQHGQMMEVGFDLYCELLEDSVREYKGIKETKPQDIMIDLKVNAYIPEEYIKDEKQRIALYRRMNLLDSEKEIKELAAELNDRFGSIPKELSELIRVIYLKAEAKKSGIISLKEEKNKIVVDFSRTPEKETQNRLKDLYGEKISLGKKLILNLKGSSKEERLDNINKLITSLR